MKFKTIYSNTIWNTVFLMKFKMPFNEIIYIFNKAALHIAVEKGDIDMVKILLSCKSIDPNVLNVLKCNFQI